MHFERSAAHARAILFCFACLILAHIFRFCVVLRVGKGVSVHLAYDNTFLMDPPLHMIFL